MRAKRSNPGATHAALDRFVAALLAMTPIMPKRPNEQFSKQEAERRFEAALRGAFKTPPMPMKDIAPKRPTSRPRPRPRKALKRSSAAKAS